jgi:hypothetical protein
VKLKPALKIGLVLVTIMVAVCLAALAWIKLAPRRVPEGQPPLATIGPESLADFRAAFNASEGEVRVLAMLSPT